MMGGNAYLIENSTSVSECEGKKGLAWELLFKESH